MFKILFARLMQGSVGTRWPLIVMVLLGLLLVLALSIASTSYHQAQDRREAALHATSANLHLQAYLRGVNEVLLTEGSKSARDLVKEAGAHFDQDVKELVVHLDQQLELADLLK
ncbi:MAG: hypothetical protein O9341_01295, partial [Paucibacter sp.]|nr:hypothetical protein [Roseateles sp.]